MAGGATFAILLPMLLASVIFALYFRAQPHWLADPDAQDYAQLGRQIAAGRGPTTLFMPWNGLDYLHRRAGESGPPVPPVGAGAVSGEWPDAPWPNIGRFPLSPAMMALAFTLFGTGDEAVHLPAGLAYVLAAAGAGLLGARAYGRWAGLLAGLTTAALPMLVNYTLTGLTEPAVGALLLAVLVCVAGFRTVGTTALGGVLFGLAILTRYDTSLLALPIVSLWLLPRRDWRRAIGSFVVATLITVLPWSVFLTVVAGSPLFNLQPASIAVQASGTADGLGWYSPRYVRPFDVWQENPTRTAQLMLVELAATPNLLRKLLGWPWLLAGLFACLFATVRLVVNARRLPRSPTVGAYLPFFLLAAVVLKALTVSVTGLNLQRYYVSFVPLFLVVVAGEADTLLRLSMGKLPLSRSAGGEALLTAARAALLAVLVGSSLWTIGPLLVPAASPATAPTRGGEVEARPENLARLAEVVQPDWLVASNVPWSLAWQADRRAVPLPPTVGETAALERRFGISIDAIYVAGQVTIADAPRSWREWEELRRQGRPPPGYTLVESFPNGGRLFIRER